MPSTVKYNLPHLTRSRYVRVENGDEGFPLLTLINQVEYIPCVPAEAVEAGDYRRSSGTVFRNQ
jgi:hypothetical protein